MRPILFAVAMIGAASALASTDALAQLYPQVPMVEARFYGPGFFARRFYGPRFGPPFFRPRFFGPRFFSPAFYGPGFYGPVPRYVGSVRQRPISTRQVSTRQVSTKQVSTKQVSTKQVSTKQVYTKPASTKQGSTKQVSKRQVSARHGSTMPPAATTRVAARQSARAPIPLPDGELLTPQSEFDCRFRTASGDPVSGQPQPSPTRAPADPSTDVALRMKLDYERECYRHAEIILRDRLRQLQAAVGETIEAVNRRERPAATTGISTGPTSGPLIPLPDPALLAPPPEFDCAFKTTGVDNVSDQRQPISEGVLRMKLDYERECHRHAEIILRDRLRLLQVSVGETIKAAVFGTGKPDGR